MTAPDVALVNNAQREHQEFLDGVEATARENGSVFSRLAAGGTAVFPGDDACAPIWRERVAAQVCLEFGFAQAGGTLDVWADPAADPAGFRLHIGDRALDITLDLLGSHNVRNALAAAACATAAGIADAAIVAGLAAFRAVNGRMQRKRAASGALLIDDTYNANPDSVLAAIDVLGSCAEPRILVLGDMGEVGDDGPAFHREVGAHARARGIQAVLAIGPMSAGAVAAFGRGAVHFEDVDALARAAVGMAGARASILVKGSRFMRMERVVDALGAPATADAEAH